MIKITKGKEPAEWTEQKNTPGIDYLTADKDALRLSLLAEQGGICGYCMRRIRFTPGEKTDTRIEHIRPRTLSLREGKPEETLAYSNMILCCNGDLEDNNKTHCDRSKDEQCISFTPFETAAMNTISYSSKDGRIKSSNAQINDEINNVLNLNHPRLAVNRLAVLCGIRKELGKKISWKKSEMKHKLEYFQNRTADGNYQEYCGIAIWYLKNKIMANA